MFRLRHGLSPQKIGPHSTGDDQRVLSHVSLWRLTQVQLLRLWRKRQRIGRLLGQLLLVVVRMLWRLLVLVMVLLAGRRGRIRWWWITAESGTNGKRITKAMMLKL